MKFLEEILKIEKEQVDVNFLFNHIRNYVLSATVFGAGIYTIIHRGSLEFIPYLDAIMGLLLMLTGISAYSLNLMHGVKAALSFNISKLKYYSFSYLLALGALYFLASFIGKAA